jgi:DNA-binding NarL/FixJ family response regulator
MLLKQFRPADRNELAGDGASDLELPVLSDREHEVLRLVAQGYVNKEIAFRLGIGLATVSTHIKNLYKKLAVHTRVQVVRVAQERGLI